MFKIPQLFYAFDALEPYIDAKTMEIHHDKHHQAYADKLNAALEGTIYADLEIEEVLARIDEIPDEKRQAVINHGGGFANHNFFWEIMDPSTPPGDSVEPNSGKGPVGELAEAIIKTFGSIDEFKTKFAEAAISRFGSGWAWLVKNEAGELEIYSTPNQDSPLMGGDVPIIGLDVWEHAYYLKYQNRRADYIDAWWNVVNWNKANENFKN